MEEIHAGADVKRVDTMLDELCVTLILASQEPCEAGEFQKILKKKNGAQVAVGIHE